MPSDHDVVPALVKPFDVHSVKKLLDEGAVVDIGAAMTKSRRKRLIPTFRELGPVDRLVVKRLLFDMVRQVTNSESSMARI